MRKTKHILSIISFIASIICGFMAMWIPPAGIIDPTVLWWTAQLLVFTAGLLGIDIHYDGIGHRADSRQNDRHNPELR